jgi:hypothetical protein
VVHIWNKKFGADGATLWAGLQNPHFARNRVARDAADLGSGPTLLLAQRHRGRQPHLVGRSRLRPYQVTSVDWLFYPILDTTEAGERRVGRARLAHLAEANLGYLMAATLLATGIVILRLTLICYRGTENTPGLLRPSASSPECRRLRSIFEKISHKCDPAHTVRRVDGV